MNDHPSCVLLNFNTQNKNHEREQKSDTIKMPKLESDKYRFSNKTKQKMAEIWNWCSSSSFIQFFVSHSRTYSSCFIVCFIADTFLDLLVFGVIKMGIECKGSFYTKKHDVWALNFDWFKSWFHFQSDSRNYHQIVCMYLYICIFDACTLKHISTYVCMYKFFIVWTKTEIDRIYSKIIYS